MALEVKTETVDYEGVSILLVSVKNSESIIGTCSMGYTGTLNSISKMFYIGTDPVLNIACPSRGNTAANKMISFCPGYKGLDQKIAGVINNGFSKLNSNEPPGAALRDVIGMLQDGVYAVYTADYYPTDGNGTFFWGGYNISHEIRGTAEHGRVVGNRVFKPCFLIPSQPMEYYTAKTRATTADAVKHRKYQGIVYHLSGFHSVLLKGHHGAVCCMENDIPFKCAVIEKVSEPYTDPIIPQLPKSAEPEAVPDPENPEAAAAVAETVPQEPNEKVIPPVMMPEGITGFRSAALKLPLDVFPKEMLRMIVEGRSEYKPRQFDTLNAKLNAARRKAVSNNVLPYVVLEKSDLVPDIDMLESAYAVDDLTDEQLNCLLAGDVEYNGKVIISPNFYSSIITACNYLQFSDMKRFVDFSIAILNNPELAATHEYVARRTLSHITNKKLNNFYKDVVASGDPKYEKIFEIAQTFINRASTK